MIQIACKNIKNCFFFMDFINGFSSSRISSAGSAKLSRIGNIFYEKFFLHLVCGPPVPDKENREWAATLGIKF